MPTEIYCGKNSHFDPYSSTRKRKRLIDIRTAKKRSCSYEGVDGTTLEDEASALKYKGLPVVDKHRLNVLCLVYKALQQYADKASFTFEYIGYIPSVDRFVAGISRLDEVDGRIPEMVFIAFGGSTLSITNVIPYTGLSIYGVDMEIGHSPFRDIHDRNNDIVDVLVD